MTNVRRKTGEFVHLHISEELKMVSGSRVSGSLIPKVTDNPDHSLGHPDVPWHDAYLSSGSLYIDNRRTLYAESGSIKMREGVSIGDEDFMLILRDIKTRMMDLETRVTDLEKPGR